MGYKFEVLAWKQCLVKGYVDEVYYQGDSLLKAIKAMFVAKKHSGCVTLKWR